MAIFGLTAQEHLSMPMWRDLIVRVRFASSEDELPVWRFFEPASATDISLVERTFNIGLPDDLKSFLLATNGLDVDHGEGFVHRFFLNSKQIIEENQRLRSRDCYMPFDHLLAFGFPGNGDFFAYGIRSDGKVSPAIYLWDHETDSRLKAFDNLEALICEFNK
jgi:hypothetical protein